MTNPTTILGLAVEILRVLPGSPRPGLIEGRFVDAAGAVWTFVDHLPAVAFGPLDATSPYPQPGMLVCRRVAEVHVNDQATVTVETRIRRTLDAAHEPVLVVVAADRLREYRLDELFTRWRAREP